MAQADAEFQKLKLQKSVADAEAKVQTAKLRKNGKKLQLKQLEAQKNRAQDNLKRQQQAEEAEWLAKNAAARLAAQLKKMPESRWKDMMGRAVGWSKQPPTSRRPLPVAMPRILKAPPRSEFRFISHHRILENKKK